MPVPPEKLREATLLVLFATYNHGTEEDGLISSLMHQLKMSRSKVKVAWIRATEINRQSNSLVKDLEKICEHYTWDRIGKVEQAILILAAWELKLDPEPLPFKIVLSEATRLAKKFSGLESAKFVNAVLQSFYEGTRLASELSWQDPQIDKVLESLQQGAQLEETREPDSLIQG
jgi:N utilization substance protein B